METTNSERLYNIIFHHITYNLGFEGGLQLPTLQLVPFNGLEEQVCFNVLCSCLGVAPQSMSRMLVQKLEGHTHHAPCAITRVNGLGVNTLSPNQNSSLAMYEKGREGLESSLDKLGPNYKAHALACCLTDQIAQESKHLNHIIMSSGYCPDRIWMVLTPCMIFLAGSERPRG